MQYELGIIGAGNMAEAIARGVLSAGIFSPSQIIAADLSAERRSLFQEQLKVHTTQNAAEAAANSAALLLSVKPYQIKQVLAGLQPALNPHTLILSIAAGISTTAIQQALNATAAPDKPAHTSRAFRIIRAMPNTPMLVAHGMVAICPSAGASTQDMATARRIFETAARVIEVTEDKMDAVTAVSGSGPAYFFYLVEYMTQAGEQLGLPPEQAAILAKQTALGAARLLLDSPDSPAELRRKVTTPGGTTAAAIATFDAGHMGQTITDAIAAAARRSHEMGQ